MGMKGFLSIIVGFVFKPAFDAAEKGAKQGNPFEQFNLGLMYYKGRGTAQDYTKAVNWWRRAAEQDFAEALNNLGSALAMSGEFTEAIELFEQTLARDPSHPQARENLALARELERENSR